VALLGEQDRLLPMSLGYMLGVWIDQSRSQAETIKTMSTMIEKAA
jgi:hypothetical protein